MNQHPYICIDSQVAMVSGIIHSEVCTLRRQTPRCALFFHTCTPRHRLSLTYSFVQRWKEETRRKTSQNKLISDKLKNTSKRHVFNTLKKGGEERGHRHWQTEYNRGVCLYFLKDSTAHTLFGLNVIEFEIPEDFFIFLCLSLLLPFGVASSSYHEKHKMFNKDLFCGRRVSASAEARNCPGK